MVWSVKKYDNNDNLIVDYGTYNNMRDIKSIVIGYKATDLSDIGIDNSDLICYYRKNCKMYYIVERIE